MQYFHKIGVLAFHGDVIEHIDVTKNAAKMLKLSIEVLEVRTLQDLRMADGLIIPGGESTNLYKLSEREGMFDGMKKMRNIFGTCAGAIMLAKVINNKTEGQKTLEVMDIEIDRNAYGRQADSFEMPVKTVIGSLQAVFIRAPKITKIGKGVKILAQMDNQILAVEQRKADSYYLATTFHPELVSTLFHEYFLRQVFHLP